jgi:MPBQ/MSBQ methyltransferase
MKITYPHPNNFDLELNLYTKVLKLKSLHWGYWLKNEKLTKDNLEKAQRRYTEKIIETIPKGVKTILDVGAGIGDNAQALSKSGFRVFALSPEPSQEEIFREICKKDKNITFIQSKYEDFNTKDKFDLILMSESSNYFPLKEGAVQSKAVLKKDGYLLVFGLFRKKNTPEYSEWNVASAFEKEYKLKGFKIIRKVDITEQVTPSMDLAYNYYRQHLSPFIEVMTTYYQRAFKLKAKLLLLVFRKEVQFLKTIVTKVIPERLDVEKYKKFGRYYIYLFQLSPEV